MPLVAHYTPNGIFYNGSENNDDGTVTMTREFPIPFQRNRFCNPLGRLLGPRGQTVKWLRRETGCDIIVHTNDVRFLKVDSKVTIKAKDDPSKVKAKMDHAIQLVLAIINPNDPGNTAMSDYQLFHPEDPENESLSWVPSNFNSANSGPTPPQNVAPGVEAPVSSGQPTLSDSTSQDIRSSSSASRSSAASSSSSSFTSSSSGSVRQSMAPSAINQRQAPSFAPTYGSTFGTPFFAQPSPYLQQPYGGMQMNSYDPWFPLQMSYAPRQLPQQQQQAPQPFFHSQNLSRNYRW